MRYRLRPRPSQRRPPVTDHSACPQPPPADHPRRGRRLGAAGRPITGLLAVLTAVAAQGAWARPQALQAGPAAAPSGNRFGVYGLGPAQAGQGLAQAESALGQPLKVETGPSVRPVKAGLASTIAADCQYRGTASQPGVRYAVAGEVITRIETRDARYATLSGVHVGDSLARAQQAYGKRLVSTPHPYFDQGRMLTVYAPDRRFALVMETNDAGRIITLRGGRLPEVGWLEGCS